MFCNPAPFGSSFNFITIVSELPLSLTCVTSYSSLFDSPKFTISPTPNTVASVTDIVVCPADSSALVVVTAVCS